MLQMENFKKYIDMQGGGLYNDDVKEMEQKWKCFHY